MGRSSKTPAPADQQLARAEHLRQTSFPQVEFTQRRCYICGGSAEPFAGTDLPDGTLFRFISGALSAGGLRDVARSVGLADSTCWTSLSGVSICRVTTGKTSKRGG